MRAASPSCQPLLTPVIPLCDVRHSCSNATLRIAVAGRTVLCERFAPSPKASLAGEAHAGWDPSYPTLDVVSSLPSLLGWCFGAWAAGEVRPTSGGGTISTRSPIA
jgi:hypothetical protein